MRPDIAARKRTLAGRALALLLLSTAAVAGPVSGQGFDPTKANGVTPVPSERWGDLKPAAWLEIPSNPLKPSVIGDSTKWNFGGTPGQNNPFFYSVDVENGYVFAATGKGLMMWKEALETTDPDVDTAPVLMDQVYAPQVVPDWHQSDLKFYLHGIDAPDGDATVVAVASVFNNGMLIWKVDDVTGGTKSITLKYQDTEKTGSQVWATKIGGVSYAFYAATSHKVLVYNLDEAKEINGTCLDLSPTTVTCPGVYKGKINTQTAASYVAGTGNFLAVSQSFLGVEIWNVANPAQPQKVLQAAPPGGTRGVALWKDGNSYFLAAVGTTAPALRIYNVTCITSGSCPSSFGNPVGTFDVNPSSIFVTASKKNSTIPFLYVGGEDQFTGGDQREYVLDVSNPAAPNDVTPHASAGAYWGWYYFGNSTGFNWVMPRSAKFQGNFLYRAAYGLMDVHKHTGGGPPAANFDWSPATVYAGDPITFNDRSTGGPDGWTWTFQDAAPANSSDQNPVGVTFASIGPKTVNLHIAKGSLVDDEPKVITVIDPVPQIGEMSVSPLSPVVCQPITIKAVGVTGKQPLGFVWTLDSSPQAATGDTLTWTPAQNEAGSHTAAVTVSNVGSDSDSAAISVTGLQSLPTAILPTNDPFTAGTVVFHALQTVGSAVWWSWDFDDDINPSTATWTAWSNNPATGPNPSHNYTTKGIRSVRVRVSQHCTVPDDSNAVLSLPLAIDIQNPIALKAQFLAQCSLGFCAFSVGEAISFIDTSTGAELYDYSWDGDTNFEDANHTSPVNSHTYSAQGDFQPRLRVRRGSGESDILQLEKVLRVRPGGGGGNNGTPSISITGPSAGNMGASLSFNANASNCTANNSGWTWNAGGGTLTGSGSSVTISWASAGSKTITATNTGCAGATGSKTVTITDTTPAVLKAEFTYTPVGAKQGQLVSFNGTSSTGGATTYAWNFGDGGTATGSTTTHTFAAAGNYVVTLSVTKSGSGCAPAPFCENSVQKTVGIASNGPVASFSSSHCISELGILLCGAKAGDVVTFTDTSTGTVSSRTWNFGDGSPVVTGGVTVTHVFNKSGSFLVALTVSDAGNTSSFAKNIGISGEVVVPIVLPWIAQSRGALEQSSDLYVHNPGTTEMEVLLEFRKQGLPEVAPPQATRTIQPGATLYVADVIKELFNRENIVGFVSLTKTKGDAKPVMTSFNTTFGNDGSQFGQTIPGFPLSLEGAAASISGRRVQYLVGLNDNSDREAYFGLTNPNNDPATYRLKFFDSLGRPIGTSSGDLTISRYGLKQFQPAEIRSKFGLNTLDDYRVEVETVSGKQLYPYGANVRTLSDDPSFLGVGSSSKSKLYLLGAMSTPGLNKTSWQTDVVLANVGTQLALADVSFLKAGLQSQPTSPLHITLQPGETQRLENIVGTQWNIKDSVGLIIVDSNSPNGVFPVVQGESYETSNTNPAMRFGQFMAAFTDEDAATVGQSHYLVGLRQDATSRTTYWLYNPSNLPGSYDLIYRRLDGSEIGRISAASLGAGKLRQLSPSQHPLPAEGVAGGFTLQVVVRSGKVLAAGQIVNNHTNDPAYVQGQAQ